LFLIAAQTAVDAMCLPKPPLTSKIIFIILLL
jgi:hypothetical protein